MIGGKKVIGVCMTKIHDMPRSRMVDYLFCEAEKNNMKVMVFNSSFDFYFNAEEDLGAAQVYEYINYEIVDALIILCSGFLDKQVFRNIIASAKMHHIPVVLEDEEDPYCYTVRNGFEQTLPALFNHVIRDHGVTDTFFIAGIPGNEFSEKRLDVYKRVLEENHLPFDESMVDYGYFWDMPTDKVMDRLFERNKPLPGAIFCANDAMAIQVCKRLIQKGIRVPEDVIVTGFDGSKLSEFASPQLSGCIANMQSFIHKCVCLLQDLFAGKSVEQVWENPYSLRLTESCGCTDVVKQDIRKMAEENYKMVIDLVGHEHLLYNETLFRLNSTGVDINSFFEAISNIMTDNSCLALSPSFLLVASGQMKMEETVDEELMIVAPKNFNRFDGSTALFSRSDMIPFLEDWENDASICVVNSIQVGKMVCGYYITWTNQIVRDAQIINRILNMMNMIIHIAVSDMRSRFLKISKNQNSLIDAVTELPNLRGVTHWFENFVAQKDNQKRWISVSVYELPQYSTIYDCYGIQEIETVLCLVAEALKISNSVQSYVAHISEDQFLVINYGDSMEKLQENVDNCVLRFYSILSNYNSAGQKEYELEVMSGKVLAEVGTVEKMEALVHQANADLIQNIWKYKQTPVKNLTKTSKQQFKLFSALVDNNLFTYHFQPIVSAKTGEIFGYEALMRTHESIGLNPMEIINIATDLRRLYDIEKSTIFNVMERYVAEQEKFCGRKVFLNCIPGHFLKEKENEVVTSRFGEYIDQFVFEITEQDSIKDSELSIIRSIGNVKKNNAIAVDDYGTGHSNIGNLIKYKPEIVKIDRFLMTDIHKDESKQTVVAGILAFARLNNIKVLAEGIETQEECRKVIELGVDFIQGFYTGRPAPEPAREIAPEIKAVIIDANKAR